MRFLLGTDLLDDHIQNQTTICQAVFDAIIHG